MHAFDVYRLTDGQTDGRTDRNLIVRPRLHSMQRGKNSFQNMVECYFDHGLNEVRNNGVRCTWVQLSQQVDSLHSSSSSAAAAAAAATTSVEKAATSRSVLCHTLFARLTAFSARR